MKADEVWEGAELLRREEEGAEPFKMVLAAERDAMTWRQRERFILMGIQGMKGV